ncbi:MAG: hypothetical protein KJ904_01300 [Alphaproteobacteria bacterium]|nr:hypothetical protein [Alphaproteobacteria bacterium]MBU0796069.1 hypothetical protein [Alphaproteobacteria bacterium]MBU0885780.1 hypothetical protein [Alphaproteobacteria bacterium]MBU1814483.1 hypothetical protein [Alphaproteobacteria bacterium]MBU2089248.1 hypothetical protein [Alphaproteobacteria bacterium]
MIRTLIVLVAVGLLSACGGRFAGLNTCSADGSVVLVEYPDKDGSYEGLNNGPCDRPS